MPRHNSHTVAIDFVAPRTDAEAERIEANWVAAGYEYWTTRDMVEMWRHPETGHVAEMATY